MEEKCEPERRTARTDQVTISLNPDGSVGVDPYYAIFLKHQELVFVYAEDAPWAVGFHGKRTPTDTLVIHGHGAHMDGPHQGLKRGHFPYTVAVVGRNEEFMRRFPTIFLDAACPEIIIE